MGEHCKETGPSIPWDNIKIVGRENNTSRRKIREALEIASANPTLNRDTGYELPPIYGPLLRSRDQLTGGANSANSGSPAVTMRG